MSGTNIKLYKNDKLICDCTLCTNPEGRIGWWDAVEGKFHDETEIFLERAYREPIGTQYIDTGVKPENVRMTNADHIRSMTDEELADFLDSVYCHGWSKGANDILDDDPYYQDWLKQPYKEDA